MNPRLSVRKVEFETGEVYYEIGGEIYEYVQENDDDSENSITPMLSTVLEDPGGEERAGDAGDNVNQYGSSTIEEVSS